MTIDFGRLRERIVQLTRDLVLVRSTDGRPEERRRCFQLIRNHLEVIPDITIRTLESNGYESLVAMPAGISRPELLFCAHLDVVEHPALNSHESVISDGRVIGPGAGDMKGQLAVLLELCRQLWRERPGLSIGLAITSDEERGGTDGMRYLVEEAGIDCGVAVIPDGGSLTDIIIAEKGILHLRLRAEGYPAHAARPWLGDNALERLIHEIGVLKREVFDPLMPARVDPDDLSTHWFPTCSVTRMETPNDSANRVPELAEAVLDIRFPSPWTVTSIQEQVRAALAPRVSIEVVMSAEPTHLAADPRFVEITGEVAGLPTRLVRACGGSDARYFCARGIPVLLSRPRVGNLHGQDEWIEIESMLTYFEICRRYALEKA